MIFKKFQKLKFLLLAAILGTGFGFSACGRTQTDGQQIVVTQAPPPVYSEESAAAMEETIAALLTAFLKARSNIAELPQATQETLRVYAADADEIIRSVGISAEAYSALNEILASETALSAANGLTLASAAPLLGKIATAVGFGRTGEITYLLLLYAYDVNYNLNIARYEQYGYPHLLLQAQTVAAEKEQFEKEIGLENFTLALRTLCALGTLAEGGLGNGIASLLSDGEILALVQAQKSFNLTLSDEGWQLLLHHLQKLCGDSYFGELLACAEENGDIAQIAARMNALFDLLHCIQQNMTVQQAALLRQGKTRELAISALRGFNERQWELWEEVTNLNLSDGYDDIAGKRFGAEYTEYCQNITVYSLNELKAAVDGDDFYLTLEGYAAGICPAVAYGLFS